MGMSTHVVGFKPPDEKWQRMKAVYDSCQAAGISVPRMVEAFFEGVPPDPNGVEISERELRDCGAVREWTDGNGEGYEVITSKLPKDVTVIRFKNSW